MKTILYHSNGEDYVSVEPSATIPDHCEITGNKINGSAGSLEAALRLVYSEDYVYDHRHDHARIGRPRHPVSEVRALLRRILARDIGRKGDIVIPADSGHREQMQELLSKGMPW